METPVFRLSCEQCKHRKTKCDKRTPCSACSRAGIKCTAVERHRLPRGRSGNRKLAARALRSRVDRLENIVSGLPPTAPLNSKQPTNAETRPNGLETYIAPEFWSDLSNAVAGLREILDGADFDDDDDQGEDEDQYHYQHPLSPGKTGTTTNLNANSILFKSHRYPTSDIDDTFPPPSVQMWLLDVYRERVDVMFKVLHWPSARKMLDACRNGRPCAMNGADIRALEFAIYFTSTCSLQDHELDSRQEIVAHYRQATEQALTRANLVTTTSLVVLQAFVIYLAGLRASQAHADQWALFALAVRLANAQGLPTALSSMPACLDTEIRRRLWFCIGVLDLQSAFDRGSKPMLSSRDFAQMPTDVDDNELSHPPPYSFSLGLRSSDMTFNILVFRAGTCQRRLNELSFSADATSSHVEAAAIGHQQLAALADFEHHVRQLASLYASSPVLFHKFTLAVGEECLATMRLLLYRPLHKRRMKSAPVVYSLGKPPNLLGLATAVLESSQTKRFTHEFAQWAWYAWLKWFALAIVLAELCTAQDSPHTAHAWAVAKRSFDDYRQLVADTEAGLLWKPIERLMRRVRAIRAEQKSAHQPTIPALCSEAPRLAVPKLDDTDALQFTHPNQKDAVRVDVGRELSAVGAAYSWEHSHPGPIEMDESWLQWDLLVNDMNNPGLWPTPNEDVHLINGVQ